MATRTRTRATQRTTTTTPSGDSIAVSIGPTGQTTLRSTDPREKLLGAVTVRGLSHGQAIAKKGGFWGRLWDGIKAAVRKIIDVITFDVGGASCRPNASVGTSKGQISRVTLGISCIN